MPKRSRKRAAASVRSKDAKPKTAVEDQEKLGENQANQPDEASTSTCSNLGRNTSTRAKRPTKRPHPTPPHTPTHDNTCTEGSSKVSKRPTKRPPSKVGNCGRLKEIEAQIRLLPAASGETVTQMCSMDTPDLEVSSRLDPDPGNHGAKKCTVRLAEITRRMGPPENLRGSTTALCKLLRVNKDRTTKESLATIASKVPPTQDANFSNFTCLTEEEVNDIALDLKRLGCKHLNFEKIRSEMVRNIDNYAEVSSIIRNGIEMGAKELEEEDEFHAMTHGGTKIVQAAAALLKKIFE